MQVYCSVRMQEVYIAIFLSFFKFFYLYRCFASVYVYHMHALYARRPEKSIGSPELELVFSYHVDAGY